MAGFIGRMDGRRDQMAVVLSGTLGVRRHEALAVRWSDIDWDAGEVQISRGIIELPDRPPPWTTSRRRPAAASCPSRTTPSPIFGSTARPS